MDYTPSDNSLTMAHDKNSTLSSSSPSSSPCCSRSNRSKLHIEYATTVKPEWSTSTHNPPQDRYVTYNSFTGMYTFATDQREQPTPPDIDTSYTNTLTFVRDKLLATWGPYVTTRDAPWNYQELCFIGPLAQQHQSSTMLKNIPLPDLTTFRTHLPHWLEASLMEEYVSFPTLFRHDKPFLLIMTRMSYWINMKADQLHFKWISDILHHQRMTLR
jgi:hypothetical protein